MTNSQVGVRASLLPRVELTLFISGASALSACAITETRQLCDLHLRGCQLVVIDLTEDPTAAFNSGVLASPTLVRNHPLPVRRHVGDLSHHDRVLLGLDLAPVDKPHATAR